MKQFIILLFLFPLLTEANLSSPFSFNDGKELKANPYEYRRYIRPQLQTILKEYYGLYNAFSFTSFKIDRIRYALADIYTFSKKAVNNCSKIEDENCINGLKSIIETAERLEAHYHNLRVKIVSSLDQSGQISSERILLDIQRTLQDIEELKRLAFNSIGIAQAEVDTLGIKVRSEKLFTSFDSLLINILPPKDRIFFAEVQQNFIKVIERQLLYEDKTLVLTKNLERLNYAWNHFHLAVAKTLSPKQNQLKKQFKLLHNRWNSVLKLLLN